jgi:Calx-beta domain
MRNLFSFQGRSVARRPRATRSRRMSLERLETRELLSNTTVSVNDVTVNEGDSSYRLMNYLVPPDADGLAAARYLRIGPADGKVYVASEDTNVVKVFDPTTGALLRDLGTSGGELVGPWAMTFGPDGLLYVGGVYSQNIVRFDITTGAYDVFVSAANSGGLAAPKGLAFGPDGNLYVSSNHTSPIPTTTDTVKRYNGAGAYLGDFVTADSGGLDGANGVAFGPDGNLYVGAHKTNSVLRYNGQTGSFMGTFIAPGSAGLNGLGDVLFHTDGTVYLPVSNSQVPGVLRYNSTTGAFLGAFESGQVGGDIAFSASGEAFVSLSTPIHSPGSSVLRYAPASFYAAFTVSLAQPLQSPVSVDYSTADGTAVAGSDYLATSGTLVFAAGQTTQTVLVRTLDDANTAPTETFTLNLSNPSPSTLVTIARGQGVATMIEENATKFYVVNDGSSLDQTYTYSRSGGANGSSTLSSGDTAPRGDASTAAGTTVWAVDANKNVYVYSTGGSLLGSWSAGSLSSHARVEGIATNGTDVWLVDAYQGKVFKYTNAAGRLSGSQNAASSFSLNRSDSNPTDVVTDGTSFWVVDDGSTDMVFKYNLSGSLLGSWTISGAGSSPTGITLDPSNVSNLWIVDSGTDRVYQFDNAASLTSGSQWPSTSFVLASGNTNPQGIADPPSGGPLRTTR